MEMARKRETWRNCFLYIEVWDEQTRSEFLDAICEILDDCCLGLWFLSLNHILFCKWSNGTLAEKAKWRKHYCQLKCWHKYEKCCSCFTTSWFHLFQHGVCVCVCVCVRAQPCLTLCDPMDCSPPGSSVHGISQARILEWVAISNSATASNYLR